MRGAKYFLKIKQVVGKSRREEREPPALFKKLSGVNIILQCGAGSKKNYSKPSYSRTVSCESICRIVSSATATTIKIAVPEIFKT